ncbi:hypothetical protein FRACA_460013 [Frankia canadensis]|uniref:Thioesterase domain-containing protein n=1 Tax=Frankia canadensis TaxID=1836972 RepID=A0A2I2KXN7_9ACTN|nr:hotdog fold thioesterase [Frankia canadensis]SNQ50423.1 hypothetical protein FRACA_460013 [Frankia canadensis]SOU57713.1 hypothetical protein FRACA_460013 [Frankia canadensis]
MTDTLDSAPVDESSPHLARLRATVAAGADLIPAHRYFGTRITEVAPGHAVYAQRVDGRILDEAGRLAPGTLFIAIDGALGSAVASTVPAGKVMTTLEIHAHFLRLGRPAGERLHLWGRVDHASARSVISSGEVVEAEGGAVIAYVSTKCALLTVPPSPRPAPVSAPLAAPDPTTTTSSPDWRPYLRLRTADVCAAAATLTAVADPSLINSRGQIQGGVLAMLAERAMSAALDEASPTPAGAAVDGETFDFTFVRSIPGDGSALTATAEVEHPGRRFAVARAVVADAAGRTLVLARASRLR